MELVTVKLSTKTQKSLLIGFGVGVFAISIYALLFFLHQKGYLTAKDQFYYLSIADSILQSGEVLDITQVPAKPVLTPQNGIVLVFLGLASLGLGLEGRLAGISIINYLLYLSAVYPLYEIARRLGLTGTWPMAALLGVYVGAWHILDLQFAPLNGGIFNALSIWLIYFIIFSYDETERGVLTRRGTIYLLLAAALAIILVHFRLQTLFILAAGILTPLLVRQYRAVLWPIGLLLVTLVSISIPYFLWVDSHSISANIGRYSYVTSYDDRIAQQFSRVISWVSKAIPKLLFRDLESPMNLFYLVFALALGIALLIGLRRRNAALLLVGLICLVSIVVSLVLLAPSTRYLVYLFPLLYLLILLPRQTRPIGYLLVGLVLIVSLTKFRFGLNIPPPQTNPFWRHLYQEQVVRPADQPLLISEIPRRSYFSLGAPAFTGELTWERIMAHQALFLVGSEPYVSTQLSRVVQLAEAENYTFQQRSMTPNYQDEAGHILLQLYDFVPRNETSAGSKR